MQPVAKHAKRDAPLFAVGEPVVNKDKSFFPLKLKRVREIQPVLLKVGAPLRLVPFEFYRTAY